MSGSHTNRVESVCEEFSDWVLYDSNHSSVMVNVSCDFYTTLKTELEKLGYIQVLFYELTELSSITCVFIRRT